MYILHLITQHNQPAGSFRQCCEICGIQKGKITWTDDLNLWNSPNMEFEGSYLKCGSLEALMWEVMGS